MVGYHFCSIDKNGRVYGHGWYFNMADIDYFFCAQSVLQYDLIKVR